MEPALSPRARKRGSFSLAGPAAFEPVIKEGNQDEMDDAAMNMSAMAETLESGSEDQITLVLFETQQVLQFCREFAIQTLVPVICAQVLPWSVSLKVSAAEALLSVVSSKVPPVLAKTISATAFEVIGSTNDPSVSEIWGQILVTTLPHVSWSPKELDRVLDQLESPGAAGLPVPRKLTARILGSLAVCSKDDDLKRRIMHRAIDITNDGDVEVRGMISESFSLIGAAMNISVVEDELWPCIMKLIKDQDARVHAASMRSLSFIAAAHTKRTPDARFYSELLPPVILEESVNIRRAAVEDQRAVDDDTYLFLEINSEIFGELLLSCWQHITDELSRKELYKAFLAMATCNGPVIRKNCAFNMPGVSSCLVKKYRIELAAIVEFLSRDADPETKWMLAAGIHETVKILINPDTNANLFKSVLSLLKDSSPLVRMNTLAHFEELIVQLAKHNGYNSVRKLAPLFQNLQLLSEGNWRTQELLAKQLRLAAPLVPSPSIIANVLPLLYQMSEESSFLVRKAAMGAIATCLRYIPDTTERNEVMQTFRAEWAQGSVYWMRIAFIDSARAAVEIYSRCLFRDTYGSEVLKLAYDPVPNVRIRTAKILPHVAAACYQMEEFHTALEQLKKDEDRDVRDVMHGIDVVVNSSLAKGQDSFEDDMKLEDEERELYARHLQAQREAQKRKKGNIKRAKTIFFGKSSKGNGTGTPKKSITAKSGEAKEVTRTGKSPQSDTSSPNAVQDPEQKRERLGKTDDLNLNKCPPIQVTSPTVAEADLQSPPVGSSRTRSLRALRGLVTPKNSGTLPRGSSFRIKKT